MNEFRKQYNADISKKFLIGLVAHIPIFILMTFYFKTELWVATLLSGLIIAGPAVSYFKDPGHERNLYFLAVAYMMFSGVMIHLGKGMIEMHFHVFVALAILSVFGSMGAVLAAAGTIAVHHIGFWLFLPESVFNYQASF